MLVMDKGKSNLPKDVSTQMSRLGRKGAKARAASLSAAQRKEIAVRAAKARWSSKSKGKRSKP